MQVDLNNFFKYYDDKNPKHRAAVDDLERLLVNKAPELLDDTSNWIRIYRTPNTPPEPKGILLDVPWYPQTDNYQLPDSTCNSSACAMSFILSFMPCLYWLSSVSVILSPARFRLYISVRRCIKGSPL